MNSEAHILVVDDERGILDSLCKIFQREGHQVTVTDSGVEALELARSGDRIDVVLADVMMPKMSGIELLKAFKAILPAVEVVMMTAFGTVDNAVECMRAGAYDFITKPLKRAIVVRSVQRALERRTLIRENQVLRDAMGGTATGDVVGQSDAIMQTLQVVNQAAPSRATILITGESGTGKELLARQIHRISERATGPFVAVNCAALPESLLESELFGHERGAFTGATSRREGRFERAAGGTIFLDEIGETSAPVQVRLLRVLQEGEIERLGGDKVIPVDVRVVAASNRDLEAAVHEGRFREDLFYRLNVIQIEVPPLRQRHGDVPVLAHHFLRSFAQTNNKAMQGFSEAAMRALDAYEWPGNVRELQNSIERAVVLCRSDVVGLEDLSAVVQQASGSGPELKNDGIFIPFGTPLEDVERRIIRHTLDRTGGDKKLAGRLLGIAARTIYRKLDDNGGAPKDVEADKNHET